MAKTWYIRCIGCLSVAATVTDSPMRNMRCTLCSCPIEVMGSVFQDRLTITKDRCPCDERCTHAIGPDCNCVCGGKNHGTRLLVKVTVDAGGIPMVAPLEPHKARKRLAELAETKGALVKRILRHFPHAQRLTQEGLGPWDATQARRGKAYLQDIDRAGQLRSHHGRLAALKKIGEKLTTAARHTA